MQYMNESMDTAFASEVAAISEAIEARRNTLERSVGVEEEQQIAKEVIGETVREAAAAASTAAAATTPHDPGASYLDSVEPDTAAAINDLIDKVQAKGLSSAIAEAQATSPYMLDVFHDALVDKLYDTLKENKLI